MNPEFKITSEFKEVAGMVCEQSPDRLREIAEIGSSIHRIERLRGRFLEGEDLPDVFFDLRDFMQLEISYQELKERFSFISTLEVSYYSLAENFGARCAIGVGLYERIPDFIDVAKDLIAKTVWVNWKPETGEDFVNLHKRVSANLRRHLLSRWNRRNWSSPFSLIEDFKLNNTIPFQKIETSSPKNKPIHRLRNATPHLSLPTIIAVIDMGQPIEKIASLAVMGYYPDGKGLGGVARELGVKRETLSASLDIVLERLIWTREGKVLAKRTTREIIEDLKRRSIMRYPSGKNVQLTNPRLKLLDREIAIEGLSRRDRKILSLARQHHQSTFTYSTQDIGDLVGCSKIVVCRVIKKATQFPEFQSYQRTS